MAAVVVFYSALTPCWSRLSSNLTSDIARHYGRCFLGILLLSFLLPPIISYLFDKTTRPVADLLHGLGWSSGKTVFKRARAEAMFEGRRTKGHVFFF